MLGVKYLKRVVTFVKLLPYICRKQYCGAIQPWPLNLKLRTTTGRFVMGKVVFMDNCYISADTGLLEIGNCFINRNAYIVCKKGIRIGNGTIIGPNVCIVDNDHDYHSVGFAHQFLTDPIEIGENVWIGANVTILRGTKIGNNCVIGAGVVLNGSVPDDTLVRCNLEFKSKKISRKTDKCSDR